MWHQKILHLLLSVYNVISSSQTLAVTAWQWLKLEWYWAVPAFLFGAVVLGVCVRVIRNRTRVAPGVAEPETIQEEISQEDIEKDSTAAAVLDAPTVEQEKCDPLEEVKGPDVNGNGHQISDEQRVTQGARNERIRAEIEALHKARVEQQERIEASTVGRSGDRPLEESGRLKESNHTSKMVSAFLPNAFSGQLGNRLESAARSESTKTQTDSAEDFRFITNLFDDPSPDVRNVAARALYHLQSDRAASFTRALREASPERRRRIGAALATSGLATDALSNLAGENPDKAYDAFSVLFLMAKAGEVQSLINTIEDGPNLEVRLAVVKLLALSGQTEVVAAFRRLAVRSSLPPEVRSAVMEAIHQLRGQ